MSPAGRRVAVVGGGMTGLAAAQRLLHDDRRPAEVVLIEADERVGGKLRTSPFAGHPAIDEGPDAFLARLPWATGLARDVGLADQLVSPASGSAAVWWNRLHPIPAGLLLGMPTEVMALARSRLLTWPGKMRAATEPFRRRTSLDGDSLGAYVRSRFGKQVHERLVDPLVGSIYAADTDRFSLAAVPQIAELAARSRSVLLAARSAPRAAAPASKSPVFYAPRHGMGALAAAIADDVRSHGGEVRLGTSAQTLAADGPGWRIDGEHFDAVVLATPAEVTGMLLRAVAPTTAATVATVGAADVAIVTLAIPAAQWPDRLRGMSGYLVPKPVQRLVTAGSFGSQKWHHWAVDDTVVLRISLGRDGLPVLHLSDEELLTAAVEESSRHLGVQLQPHHQRISRWPGAFPQYRPHHARLVAAAEAALPAGLALAGASFHGIGIPTCIRSAQNAATRTLHHLQQMPQ